MLLWPFYGLLFVGLVFPSDGMRGILNPKAIFFILTCLSVGWIFITQKKGLGAPLVLQLFLLSFLTFIMGWYIIALMRNADNHIYAIDQIKIFVITFSVGIITYYLVSTKLLSPQRFFKVLIYSNFFYSSVKITLLILHVIGVVSIFSVIEKIGIRTITMGIFSHLTRLQTSVDTITPFLLFFVLTNTEFNLKLNKKFKYVYLFISCISILLSFSRFLIAVSLISTMMYWASSSLMKALRGFSVLFTSIAFFVYWLGTERVFTSIYNRFFNSSNNYYSDSTRYIQIEALTNGHLEIPFFGQGFGGYIENVVRDYVVPYSYEVQWNAFLYQFGIIGMIFLAIPLMAIGFNIIAVTPLTRIRSATFILFLLWLFSGFTNPYLISLTSGIVYSMFLVAGYILNNKSEKLVSHLHNDVDALITA